MLATGSRNGWAWIALRDDGPGIPEADIERIFDRFYRVGNATTDERRAGLGLAIVRQIVESHGGSVAVHSAVGAGSTFVLWFPDRAAVGINPRTSEPPDDNPIGATSRD